MSASFVSISEGELQSLLQDTSKVTELFLRRLRERNETSGLDIDKSWAAIHFMLTGSPWGGNPPESLPILGGTPIGDDTGYGPARYLSSELVKQANGVLAALPVEKLRERFIPSALEEAEVYPAGIWVSEGEEGFAYIQHWYEKLRRFYASAAGNNNSVLLAIM